MIAAARRLSTILAAVLVLASAVLTSPRADAQDTDTSTRDAAKHFQRGVALYSEADYNAALVEFQRAYALAPNAAVLYNVGETEFQLRDYASALSTFERYLSEAGAGDPHRAEVESNVRTLRSRVGHLSVVTLPAGAEITLDDQPLGRTPLEGPALLVSVGRRKVSASMAGRPPVTRFVDVAADDNVSVVLQIPPSPDAAAGRTAHAQTATQGQPAPGEATPASGGGSSLRVAGWIATGALAGGAIAFALLASKASSDLKTTRNTFPTTSGTLTRDANLVSTYSALADSLAAAAIVVGGVTLVSALSSSSTSVATPRPEAAGAARVSVGPTSVRLDMTF